MQLVSLLALTTLTLSPLQAETQEREIRKVLLNQVEAWNRGDLDGFLSAYWQDDAVTFYSGGDVSKGFKSLRDRYFKRYKSDGKEMGRLSFSDLEVTPVDEKFAVSRGRFNLVLKEEKPTGLFTLWLRKFPEGWKIIHDHTSAAEKK